MDYLKCILRGAWNHISSASSKSRPQIHRWRPSCKAVHLTFPLLLCCHLNFAGSSLFFTSKHYKEGGCDCSLRWGERGCRVHFKEPIGEWHRAVRYNMILIDQKQTRMSWALWKPLTISMHAGVSIAKGGIAWAAQISEEVGVIWQEGVQIYNGI